MIVRLIDADELESLFNEQIQYVVTGLFGAFDDALQDAQTVDAVQVVHGRWIPQHESEITGWNPEFAGRDQIGSYICSECKHEVVYDCNDEFVLSEYCPYCGVKMDGEENE